MKTINRLLTFLKPFFRMVMLSILLGTATIGSGIGLMGTSAYLISSAALHPSIGSLQVAIVGVRFFGITRSVFRYLERLVSHSLNFKLLAGMRVWFYEKIEILSPAGLKDRDSGDLLSRAVADIEELENFYIRVVSPPITGLIITLGLCLFAGKYHRMLGLVVGFGSVLNAVLLPYIIYQISKASGKKYIRHRAEITSEFVDTLQGLEDIQVFNLEGEKYQRLDQLNHAYTNKKMRVANIGALIESVTNLNNDLTVFLFLLVAIPIVSSEKMSGVMLATLTLMLIASFEAINPLSTAAQYLEGCIQAARRVFEIAEEEPEIIYKAGGQFLSRENEIQIEIRNLHFHYPDDERFALEGINMKIEAGESVALVGPNGSGKTTLINLIGRFWEYQRGRIEINNVEVRKIDLHNLRQVMSINSQNSYIFNETIRQNLLLGDDNASEENMFSVIKQVNLENWLSSMPDGLDTWLGEHGTMMSGGERQRLAIARILMKNAPFIIFDEPFSNLDIENQHHLLKTIHAVINGKTTIWITHRLVSMEFYKKIFVLKDGRIIEEGNHNKLLNSGGYYSKMYNLQKLALLDD